MSESILQNIPEAKRLLSMETEELAGYVLEHLHANGGNPLSQGNSLPHNLANGLAPRYPQSRDQVYKRILATCHWLINNGYLDIINEQGFFEISKKGNKVKTASEFGPVNNSTQAVFGNEKAVESAEIPTTENLTNANRLYDKVKNLIHNSRTLNEMDARIVIEYADDAIREFGVSNQNKKIELKGWRRKAEESLAPETWKELLDRAVKVWLAKLWPDNPKLRQGLLVIIVVTVVAGGLVTFKRTFWDRPEPTLTPPLNSTNSNDGRTSKSPFATAIPSQNAASTPVPSEGRDSGALTAVDRCFQDHFSGISRDRQQHVESGTMENPVVKRETQPKDGLLAIRLFDKNELVGGIKLTLFSSNYNPVFKDIALYNNKCVEIDSYENKTLGGDKQVLNNWHELSLRLNDHQYVLKLAYDENKANGYDKGKGAVIATFARSPENK